MAAWTSQPRMAGPPPRHGLYDPSFEHGSCGVGFVADLKGRPSHAVVEKSLTVLKNLLHRGACGCEPDTGDGAGILLQMPHAFLARACAEAGFELPPARQYGAGLVFLPQDAGEAARCRGILEGIIAEEGQRLLGF